MILEVKGCAEGLLIKLLKYFLTSSFFISERLSLAKQNMYQSYYKTMFGLEVGLIQMAQKTI